MHRIHVPNWFSNILLLDPGCGLAYDLQLLRRLMVAYDVPLVLPFMCANAREVSVWSFVTMNLDKICIWSLFRLRLTSNGLVISMINSRLCCIQVQDPAIHVYRLCFYVRYIYSQSASYQPALFIRLRELAGKPDKVLGVNLNWATNYSWPSFFMGHKKEFIDFTALSFSDILQFVRSIVVTWNRF